MTTTDSPWFVYILQCRDGTLYVGISNDVPGRVDAHNAGKGAKFTRGRRPVMLLYQEECASKSAACKREMEIKRWRRTKKMSLIRGVPFGLGLAGA